MENMDFYAMKRKKLQSLCKKHGIPANLKNVVMAEKLSLIFKGKENSGSGFDNAGTAKGGTFGGFSGKDMQNVIILDSDSSIDTSNIKMVASDIVAAGDVVDSGEEMFVSSGKISPGSDFGQKSLEIGSLEDSGGTRMVSVGVNKEQGDDIMKLHPAAPSVALEEYGDCLMEEIVEKLDEKTDVNEDVNGTRKVAAEAEKQALINNTQGSNINHGNLLHASPENSSGNLIEEGKVCQLDDNISVHAAVFNDRNNISETVIGTAVRTEDGCETKFVSSQKLIISPAEVKMIGFSPKQMHDLEPPIEDDIAMFVEENMPVGVNKELVDNSQEVLHAEPSAVVMNEKDLIQVTPEEFGKHLEEGEVEKLGDKFDLLDDDCGTGEGGDEAVEQGRINIPQESNINDMNLFHVSPEESEADSSCLDTSIGAKNTDGKTNVTADNFQDEVDSFSLKYSDGTPNKLFLTNPSSEVKSCDLNAHKIVASGTAAGNADVCEAKFVSSQKISSSQEERIDSSCILLDNSQIKRLDSKANLSPENRNELGLFYLEEHMQTNVNKEQGGDIKEFHPAAPSATSEEFRDCLVVEKVEKLDNKTDVHGDVCGPRMVAAETENQDLPYNPQGSNINHENHLHVSPEKFSGSLVEEGDVHKLDDASIDSKDNVSVKQFLDEAHSSIFQDSEGTPVLFPPTYRGTAIRTEDTCEAMFVSPQKLIISAASEKMIGFCPKQIHNLGTPIEDDIAMFDVEENMQVGVNKEQVEEFGKHLVEEEVEKLGEKFDLLHDVCGAGEGEDETVKQGGVNSPQGSTINDVNFLQVSPDLGQKSLEIGSLEESGGTRMVSVGVNKEQGDDIMKLHPAAPSVASEEYGDCLMEEIVEKLDDKTDVNGDVNGTRKVAAEAEKQALINNTQGSNINHGNLLHASPENSSGNLIEEGEVRQLDDNISVHGAVFNNRNNISESVTGTAVRSEDTCEAKFVSSQKLIISPAEEKMIGFSPKQMHDLEPPIEDDTAMFDVEENMPVGVNKELVDNSQEVLHAEPIVVVLNEKDLIQVPPEEFGKHLEEGEVEKLGDKFDLLDDDCGTGEGGDEAVEQGHINSHRGANINDMYLFHVSPEETEQVHISDDNISVHGALNIVGNERSEAHTSCLDTSIGAKNTDEKTNVTADNFLDDVHSFSLKYSDGTPNQLLQTNLSSEVKSCDLTVHKIVASGTAAGNADACEAKFVSSPKLSSSPEERIDSSPILLENSHIKSLDSKPNLSPGNRNDLGLFYVEENKQTNANKEQGGDITELHPAAPSVTSEEFGDCLVEEKVEKLDNKTDVHGDVCGTGMGAAEAEKQDLTYNPQGSNINHGNLLHFSPEKSSGSLVEEELHKLDNNNCVHVAVSNDKNNIPEAVTMCLDAFIGAKDSVSVEQILDEAHSSSLQDSEGTPVLFPPTYPGTAIRTEDTCESKFVSSQKLVISPASEKMIGFCPKQIHNLETPIEDDTAMFDLEEIMPVGVNMEQVEEFGKHLEEGEVEKLGEKIDLLDDVCGAGEGGGETMKQGGVNSLQGSNVNDVNLLQISPEESGHPLVEQVQKSDDNDFHGGFYNLGNTQSEVDILRLLNATFATMDTDGKTNVTAEHFPDEVHSSSVEYSDGTTDQFLKTHPQDTCEEMMKSSQMKAIIADLEECVWFSPNNVEASATKGFEAETHFEPSTLEDIVGACNMKESIQSDNMEKESDQKECSLVQGEFARMFDNSDVHDDNGGTGKEEYQPYTLSRKRKRSDMNSNESQPVDNASGQNSNEKPDEFVPTKSQPGEMKLRTSNTHQSFASDTASVDEVTYQEKLESPPKVTPIARSAERTFFSPKLLESAMMNKENINIDKKEQVGTITSKNKFLKRQPLQDLQQN